jgi:hypothetical protein
LSVDVTSAPVPDSGWRDGMTITGIVKNTIKLAVAFFVLWVLASTVLVVTYLALMNTLGVL